MGRRSVGALCRVDLPDAVGPVSVSSRPAQDRRPEHEPFNILPALSHNSFVVHLPYEHRHPWVSRKRSRHLVHGAGNTLSPTVARLQHIEIDHRRVLDLVSGIVGGVNRDGVMESIDRAHVPAHLRPAAFLDPGILLLCPREIIRHGALARQAPDYRIGAPASDNVSPMLLQFRHAHPGQEIAPAAHNARNQAPLDDILDSRIGGVEVSRVNTRIALLPGKAGLVCSARVKRRHVRVEPGDNLDNTEALSHAVSS